MLKWLFIVLSLRLDIKVGGKLEGMIPSWGNVLTFQFIHLTLFSSNSSSPEPLLSDVIIITCFRICLIIILTTGTTLHHHLHHHNQNEDHVDVLHLVSDLFLPLLSLPSGEIHSIPCLKQSIGHYHILQHHDYQHNHHNLYHHINQHQPHHRRNQHNQNQNHYGSSSWP